MPLPCPSLEDVCTYGWMQSGEDPYEPLLHDRHYKLSVLEYQTPSETSGTLGAGGVLHVQEPLVSAEWAVEPHGVIQARHHQITAVEALPVGQIGSVQQRHIRCVGQYALVEDRVIRQCAVGPHPDLLVRGQRLANSPRGLVRAYITGIDWPWHSGPLAEQIGSVSVAGGEVGQRLRGGDVLGRIELVLESRFGRMEGRREVEDRLTVLNGDDPPGRKRAAVPDSFYLEHDGDRWIAGAEEIGVERVHRPLLDCAVGGHQRLTGHLAAEDPLPHVVRALTPEDPVFNALQIQQLHQFIDRRLRRVARSSSGVSNTVFAHLHSVPSDRSTPVVPHPQHLSSGGYCGDSHMPLIPEQLQRLVDGRSGPAARYVLVSGINVLNHQVLLYVANSVWGWPAEWANAFAASVALVPAYFLTRSLVWSVNRTHSLSREVVPFLILAVLGLFVSSGTSAIGESLFGSGLAVNAASLIGYVAVWIAKFFILERIFAEQFEDAPGPLVAEIPSGDSVRNA